MTNRAYWNKVASEKKFTLPVDLSFLRDSLNKDDRILDYGCGYGRTLAELQEQGFRNLYGVDFSAEMIKRATLSIPEADFKVNDGICIPYPDEYFHGVIVLAVLTSIIDDRQQTELIREIIRVLKPGGLLCVSDFLLNDDQRNLDRYELGKKINGTYGVFELPDGAKLRHHRIEYLDALLSDFKVLKRDTTTFTTMNDNLSNGYNFSGQKDNSIIKK
jgi:ubiquinone/menaquinone biosynthesis C-methylase UbiE